MHGHGQPTGTTPLNEDGGEEIGYILGLLDRLVTAEFDDTGSCGHSDKAFTSIRWARKLAARRLGLVGMLRTSGRPEHRPRGDEWYLPL